MREINMPEQINKRHSRCAISSVVISATIWIYFAAILLFWGYLSAFFNMAQCNENDFGPCATKKLVGPFLALLAGIAIAVIPLTILGVGTVLGVIGCFQKKYKKDFAVVSLIHNGAVVVLAGFIGSVL